MQGGYASDRFAQGTVDVDAYRLAAWHLLDVFIYFSHSFVTIPPPTWLNAAHRHHVPVGSVLLVEKQYVVHSSLILSADSTPNILYRGCAVT